MGGMIVFKLKFNKLSDIKKFNTIKQFLLITSMSLIIGEVIGWSFQLINPYIAFICSGILIYYFLRWQWTFFDGKE